MGLDTTHNCWHGSYSANGSKMRKIALVTLIAAALASQANAGTGLWYGTAANVSRNIELKYNVEFARCYAPQMNDIKRYNAHSIIDATNTRRWDTFVCFLVLDRQGNSCTAIAYMTGREWYQFRLGTDWY